MFAWIQKLFGCKLAVKASPVLRSARTEPDAPWPRYSSNPRPLYAKPQAPPSPPPRRYYSAPAVTPNHAPAPDTSSDMMILASLMSIGSQASECRREPETEPFRSGGSGDFGGGGASGSWEAPAPSPSYDSGSSYSSSSSSDSGSSSSDSSSSSSSSSD
jgi:hypothetical protein